MFLNSLIFTSSKTLSLRRFLSLGLCLLLLAGCAARTHHRAGLQAMEKGDYAKAIEELQQATQLEPQDVIYKRDWLQNRESATNKILIQADKALAEKQFDKAEEQYRNILRYDRDNARAKYGIENIFKIRRAADDAAEARKAMKRGDVTQASQWAARALEAYPEQDEARAIKAEVEAIQAKELVNSPSLSKIYKKPINLEFRDASVKMVFDALARTTGINFIFDRDVRTDQKTTVFLKQTSLEDAIDVILTTNQLDKKILNASSILIYPNNGAKNKEYQDLIVKAFYLNNVEAKQAAALLKAILKVKDVFVDDKYNMVVVRDNPDAIALAEKLIALHDLEEAEVMLEVEVLEINRSNLLNLGVQLTNQFTVTPLANLFSGTTTSTGPSSGTTGSSSPTLKLSDLNRLNAGTLGITLPSATINLQKTDGNANLLANPRLRVRDREKAKIMIGDKVPVVTTTSTPNGFVAENIQYQDVGLRLEVEPMIHLNDEIGLKLGLEVSSIVSVTRTNSGSQAYQIGTRNLTTSLRLKDGETQILAGLINDEDRRSANRIPLIGDVPILGRLFSSQSDNRQKTEIVMSITPHLIRNVVRRGPAAESFWSGTDSSLKSKPLQLRTVDANGNTTSGSNTLNTSSAANGTASATPRVAAEPANPAAGGTPAQNDGIPAESKVQLAWTGAKEGRVGQVVKLEVQLESANPLRALPFQLAYDNTQFEIISLEEGDFFNQSGKGAFNHVIDKASGRVSIGAAASDAAGAKGKARVLTIQIKPLKEEAEASIQIIGVSPIGTNKTLYPPAVPITHVMNIAP